MSTSTLAKSATIRPGHWDCCQESPAFALVYDDGTQVEVCQPCSTTVPRKRLAGLPDASYSATIQLGKTPPMLVTSTVTFEEAKLALTEEREFLLNQGATWVRGSIVRTS